MEPLELAARWRAAGRRVAGDRGRDLGEVASLNFDRHEVPRRPGAPALEIAIMGRRDVPPAGAGEAPLIAAAIANALRDAIGRRFPRLPIRSAADAEPPRKVETLRRGSHP